MTLLFGIGWLLLLLGTWIACSYFPARWLARRLGLSPFRLFDSELRGTWAKRVAVRCMSEVAPLVWVFIIVYFRSLVSGTASPTNLVEVLAGPAREAGMQSGDRIVAVDGDRTVDFEALPRTGELLWHQSH